jgi:hypothetical protein
MFQRGGRLELIQSTARAGIRKLSFEPFELLELLELLEPPESPERRDGETMEAHD